MKQTSLAARYARALAEVVKEKPALEATAENLDGFSGVYRESKELRDFLGNPAYPLPAKLKGLRALTKRLRTPAQAARLLEILLQRGRLDLLPEVAQEFRKIEERMLDRVEVELTTAGPLDPALEKRVVASLEQYTGKKVRLTRIVDPAVLGGARTRIGSVVYDGTVATRLDKLKLLLIGEH
jgi:F-type H+-transporting ATPase subunit delta